MNQILKISIARGGCRFATPLYLGASYVLSFDGARSDEAKTVLFTKPNSRTPTKTEGIEGLAISVEEGSDIVLKLNRQSLVDWFLSCGECDVDGYVDAHCYVFNSDGDVIADDGVHIEYRPVDFVVDATGFTQYSALAERVGTLEAFRVEDRAKIDANESAIAELQGEDQNIRNEFAAAINERAGQTLESAKNYADLLRQMVAKMMYIRDVDESESAGYDRYRRVEAKKNALNEVIITLSDELFNLEGGDSSTNRYLYTDTNNVEDYDEHGDPTADHNPITGNKTFTGVVLVETPLAADNSKKPATTAWVRTFDATQWDAHKATLLGTANTWSAKQTFSGGVEGNVTGNVTGNVAGNVTGNVTGDLTGDVTGGVTVPVAKTLAVAGDETHGGAEAHAGAENHTGAVTLANVVARTASWYTQDVNGVNEKFVWDLVKIVTGYCDGAWRILWGSGNHINDNHTDNQTFWRNTSVQIGILAPEEVNIVDYAFYSCDYLYYFAAHNAKKIGEYALYKCEELHTVMMPQLEEIGAYAFYKCGALNEATAQSIFQNVKKIGALAFYYDVNNAGWFFGASVSMPKCETVGIGAFARYYTGHAQGHNMTSLNIGSEVPAARLGDATKLSNTILNNLFTYMETQTVAAPIASNGFAIPEFNKLSELFEADNAGNSLNSEFTVMFGNFHDYDKLTSFSASKTQILGDGAMLSCQNLRNVNLDECLYIGSWAFADISYQSDAYGSKKVLLDFPKCKYIGVRSFWMSVENNSYYCEPARTVKAESLEYIAREAFVRCHKLYGFYAPNVKKIGRGAFYYCPYLTGSFYVPKGSDYNPEVDTYDATLISTRGNGEVGDVDALEFPQCEYVGQDAFGYCTSVKTLKLNAATTIGTTAFANMSSLDDLYVRGFDFSGMTDDDVNYTIGTVWQVPARTTIHATDGYGVERNLTYRDSKWRWVL